MNGVDIDEEAAKWPDTFEPERWDPERRRHRRVIVICDNPRHKQRQG